MAPKSPQRTQTLFWIGVGIVILAVIYILSPILTPFLLAGILAYILRPGVDRLARKLPRWLAVLLMVTVLFLTLLMLLLILIPLIQRELAQVQQKAPGWVQNLNQVVAPRLQEWFGVTVRFDGTSLRELITGQMANLGEDWVSTVAKWAKSGFGTLAAFVGNLILLPVVLFYLLLDWHPIVRRTHALVPRRYQARVADMAREIDGLLSQFLRGQLSVMGLLALYYSAGLALAGVDAALPIGILTGLLVFVPYLGYALGLTLALIVAMLQFGNLYGLAAVGVIYGLGQVIESFVLTPYLVGERIGLHPLAVIFALMAFGQVFGFFGVLLALPMSAIFMVGMRRLVGSYETSDFYGR